MKYLLIVGLALGTATISFGQQTRSADLASAGTPAKKVSMRSSVLYLLSHDDKTTEISKEEFKKIKKKDIEYTKLLKDPALLSMYGDKAKGGVVLVQMKQSPDEKKRKGRQNSSRKTKQNANPGNDSATLSTNKIATKTQ
jgi:hypothetical protein